MKEILRSRTWAGPLTIGSFAVVAATGIVMFFHLNSGLVKLAHEWLGWLLVIGVIAHVAINWRPFVRYFCKPAGIAIMAVLLTLGVLSFFVGGPAGRQHPLMGAFTALEQSSLQVVAQVAKSNPDALLANLRTKGLRVRNGEQTIREIASENGVRSMEILGNILGNPEPHAGEHH